MREGVDLDLHAGGEPDSVVHPGGSGKQARQRLKLAKEHLRVVPFPLREDDFHLGCRGRLETRTESSTKSPTRSSATRSTTG